MLRNLLQNDAVVLGRTCWQYLQQQLCCMRLMWSGEGVTKRYNHEEGSCGACVNTKSVNIKIVHTLAYPTMANNSIQRVQLLSPHVRSTTQ